MPHAHTIECVRKADDFIERGDADSLRYATLELRLAIEYLVYELVKLYREELPENIEKRWKPQQMLEALLDCDPEADQDGRIALGSEPDKWEIVLEVKSPNMKLIKDHWHRLSHRLHAPVDLVEPNPEKWKRDLQKAADCLREYKLGQAIHNMSARIHFACDDCGQGIMRNVRAIEKTRTMTCLNATCGAIYDMELDDKGEYVGKLRKLPYECPYCRAKNVISAGALAPGLVVTCDECEKRVEARPYLHFEPIDGEPTRATEATEATDKAEA